MSQLPLGAYRAIGQLYNGLMTGLVLTLISQRGAELARQFIFGHFRRQHLEKFLPGLTKLKLDGLPDAVACAQYHYFSNALGGVKTEYIHESDRKAWVRYPPPRWIWQGTAICAIPRAVNEAMLHGWHGHNGVSLNNPRLGFVCTGQTVTGQPGLEGYYCEYDRPLAEDERVRFAYGEIAPPFDASAAPKLDSDAWPEERLQRTFRSYAMEYVRSMLPTMLALVGEADTEALLGHAGRLIGLQFYDQVAGELKMRGNGPEDFARLLCDLLAAQGESVEISRGGSTIAVEQRGWRLMQGLPQPDGACRAWAAVFGGLAASHNRHMPFALELVNSPGVNPVFTWRIG